MGSWLLRCFTQCQLAPDGVGTRNWVYEEKVQDFSSLAWTSLSLKSHVPFLLAQGSHQPAPLTEARSIMSAAVQKR